MLYNELFRAVHDQDKAMIARLIRQGISPDTIDAHGEPVLLIAARHERPDSVSALLESGANPKNRGPAGACLLHYLAAYPSNLHLVTRALDEWELDIDAPDAEGRTPLMEAVIRGCVTGARKLLELGANPLKRDHHGATVIFHFLDGIHGFRADEPHDEQLALVADLLELGIDPDAQGPGGKTALSVAAEKGLIDVIELLLEAGATVDLPEDAINPIRAAALAQHAEAAELLIRFGGTIDWFSAIALNRRDLVEKMLADDPELKNALEPDSRVCGLAIAIRHGHRELAEHLLARGADPDGPADQGKCLHAAVRALPEPAFIASLIQAGADLNAGDSDWNTPLNFAARENRVEVARLLLEEGADPNMETEKGSTPLAFATSEEMRQLIRQYGGR